MRIGELAERASVTVKAVRYYESLGLLKVERLSNGYREYKKKNEFYSKYLKFALLYVLM